MKLWNKNPLTGILLAMLLLLALCACHDKDTADSDSALDSEGSGEILYATDTTEPIDPFSNLEPSVNPNRSFPGRWVNVKQAMILNEDGTARLYTQEQRGVAATWAVEGDYMILKWETNEGRGAFNQADAPEELWVTQKINGTAYSLGYDFVTGTYPTDESQLVNTSWKDDALEIIFNEGNVARFVVQDMERMGSYELREDGVLYMQLEGNTSYELAAFGNDVLYSGPSRLARVAG